MLGQTTSAPRAAPRQIRCLLPLWGEVYIERFLRAALPSWLAPGNLPALAAHLPTEMVLLTSAGDVQFFQKNMGFQKIKSILPVQFHIIDHLITGNNYSITITLSYIEAMKALGADMLDTCFFYLVADYIIADGSLAYVLSRMMAGYDAVQVGNFQVTEKTAKPWQAGQITTLPEWADALPPRELLRRGQRWVRKSPEVIAVPPRQLLRWALRHLHPATVANTVNFGIIRNIYPNRLFWRADGCTLIGRFFLMHMICIRPQIMDFTIGASCDYSFVTEMCPGGNVEIITDSDNYLVIEMQPHSHESNFVRPGPHKSERGLVRSLSEWTTEQHRRNAQTTVVFHTDELPDNLPAIIAEADKFIARILRKLRPVPQPYRDHFYWRGSVASFREATGARLTADEKLFTLGYITFAHGRLSLLRTAAARLASRLFGNPPQASRWYPRFRDYAPVADALEGYWSGVSPDAKLLLLSERATIFTVGLPDISAHVTRVRTSQFAHRRVSTLINLPSQVDVCLVELTEDDVGLIDRVVKRIEPRMRDGGTLLISLLIRNVTDNPLGQKAQFAAHIAQLMRPALCPIQVEYVPLGRLRGWVLARLDRFARLVSRSPLWGCILAPFVVPSLLLLGWLANQGRRNGSSQFPDGPISSVLVKISVNTRGV